VVTGRCRIGGAGIRDPGEAVGRGRNGTLVNNLFTDAVPTLGSGGVRTTPIRKTSVAMDLVIFLPLLVIMGAFMYFASRRQKKAMQATIDLHESLQIGDQVHTTSGLRGTITGIADDSVELEIAPGVITTWMMLAVRDRVADDVDDVDEEDLDGTDGTDAGYDEGFEGSSQGVFEPRSTANEITERPNTKTDS
jgi:preprotein translocase subunit YajC